MQTSVRAADGASKPHSPNPAPGLPFKDRLTLRRHDACLCSGLGRSSIYELISAGRLRSVKIGSRRLILREDLDALMKSGRQGL
jgi:excisionase family DNA binding protein